MTPDATGTTPARTRVLLVEDETLIREALASAADAPGYPTTHGRRELREAVASWFARRRGVDLG